MASLVQSYIKFGYLNYSDIQNAIDEGALDIHSIVYCKDTHEQYLIKDDKSLLKIRAKVNAYGSVGLAVSDLNKTDTDAYEGQIVSIYNSSTLTFDAYTVNKDSSEKFVVTKVGSSGGGGGTTDYDQLVNAPIINASGTSSTPLVISELSNGTYKVSGYIKLPDDTTSSLVVVDTFVLVNKEANETDITVINVKYIKKYTITSEGVSKEQYITDTYIEDKGYVTSTDVDNKITVLKLVTEDQMKKYVADTLPDMITAAVQAEIAGTQATNSDIDDLFK